MTFKYDGAGWYKLANGEKTWIAGELVSDDDAHWTKEGKHQVGDYNLIEKYVEPRCWWVGIAVDVEGDIEATYKYKSEEDLRNGYSGQKLLAIHKITEGEGVE